jgi:hypothetical protein
VTVITDADGKNSIAGEATRQEVLHRYVIESVKKFAGEINRRQSESGILQ